MIKKLIITGLLVLATGFIFSEAAFTAEMDNEKEMVTSRGTVTVGMRKDMLYQIYQNQDRIFSHKILGEEWIVYRDWAAANPKTDVITFYLVDGLVTGWKRAFIPTPMNEGSIYEYKPDEKIENWFFPEGKSRWDGANMSVQEWNLLTDAQKVMFLTEYNKETDRKAGKHSSLDTSRYLLALNHFADTCSTAYISRKITDIIEKIVVENEAKPTEEPQAQGTVPAKTQNPATSNSPPGQ